MISLFLDQSFTIGLSGIISRGLVEHTPFTPFLIDGLYDPRLFIIISKLAFH